MAALAGAWAREVAADAWPGPVNEGAPRATRLFVAGGATHAGKSTVCLGILQTAREVRRPILPTSRPRPKMRRHGVAVCLE